MYQSNIALILNNEFVPALVGVGMVAISAIAMIFLSRILQKTRVQLKQAVESLRDEQENQARVLELLCDAVIITDAAGKIERMNSVAERLTSWTLTEASGRSLDEVFRIVDARDRSSRIDPMRLAITQPERTVPTTTLLLTREGKECKIANFVARRRGKQGASSGLILVFNDCAERCWSQKAIHDERQRFKDFFELTPVAMWLEDYSALGQWLAQLRERGVVNLREHLEAHPDQLREALGLIRVLDVNMAAVRQNGASSKEELIGALPRLINAEALRAFIEQLEGLWQSRNSIDLEISSRRLNGDPLHQIVHVEIPRQGDGLDLTRVVVTGTDITARRDAEAALQEKERLLTAAQRIARIGSWSLDLTTRALAWTEETCRLLGVNCESFTPTLEKTVELVHPDDRDSLREVMNLVLEGKESPSREFRLKLADGSVRTLMLRGEVFRKDGKALYVYGTIQDITLRKKREQAQRKLEEQLNQSRKMDAIGKLAGGVAHDFNNQLSAIIGYTDLLQMRVEDPKSRAYLKSIMKAAECSADLTRHLLAFARKGKMQSTLVSIHKLIQGTISVLERSIDKRIVIKQQLGARSDLVVGDPSQLESAFLNLALNARDAMPDGGELFFETRNVVENGDAFIGLGDGEKHAGSYIQIDIRDTGFGMSEEVKKHLFEPFFTTKPTGKGTGLGLASVYGTVVNHKGKITAKSESGQGALFTIYLPFANTSIVDPEPVDVAGNLNENAYPVAKGLRVLVVDDEELVRALYAEMLTSCGMKVMQAEDGKIAVEKYAQEWQQIDLVILDMIMPVMDGTDAFRAMKKINPQIKVLLSSGFSLNNRVQAILDGGGSDFIQKPFSRKELIEKILTITGKA